MAGKTGGLAGLLVSLPRQAAVQPGTYCSATLVSSWASTRFGVLPCCAHSACPTRTCAPPAPPPPPTCAPQRDLKPQNLLLSAAVPDATLKIADFGFARNLQPQVCFCVCALGAGRQLGLPRLWRGLCAALGAFLGCRQGACALRRAAAGSRPACAAQPTPLLPRHPHPRRVLRRAWPRRCAAARCTWPQRSCTSTSTMPRRTCGASAPYCMSWWVVVGRAGGGGGPGWGVAFAGLGHLLELPAGSLPLELREARNKGD